MKKTENTARAIGYGVTVAILAIICWGAYSFSSSCAVCSYHSLAFALNSILQGSLSTLTIATAGVASIAGGLVIAAIVLGSESSRLVSKKSA